MFLQGGDWKKQRELAERVATAARTTEFSELARRYSEDEATRNQGGGVTATRLEQVPPAMRRALRALDVGELGRHLARRWRLRGPEAPLARGVTALDYDTARAELGERVYVEKMNQARRTWLDNLRRQHHVEVRL